jgi:hypothetical protein
MDAVKEALLEQKIDDLTPRFDARFDHVDARFERLEAWFQQAEKRNWEEHRDSRADIQHLDRTVALGFGSIAASAIGAAAAAIIANAL